MNETQRRQGLSRQQRRTLEAIARMEASGEDGHDFQGDLSVCSRNAPATLKSLERRDLIVGTYDAYAPAEEAWTYKLTDLGSSELIRNRTAS